MIGRKVPHPKFHAATLAPFEARGQRQLREPGTRETLEPVHLGGRAEDRDGLVAEVRERSAQVGMLRISTADAVDAPEGSLDVAAGRLAL